MRTQSQPSALAKSSIFSSSGSHRFISTPPQAVTMHTLDLAERMSSVIAAASILCPQQASQSRLPRSNTDARKLS
jgi:hypothetical protein